MKIYDFITCLIITLALQFPLQVWSQQRKQLKSVDMPAKFAFVDGIRLRKEYRAYSAAKDSLYKDAVAKRKAFNEVKQQLKMETKKQLKKDSLEGGKKKELIAGNAASKQSELEYKYITEGKQRTQARLALVKSYEDKMRAAIQRVMAEGVYTELRPLKDSSILKGTNITDLVLVKLNQ
jgi:hypothetical protein